MSIKLRVERLQRYLNKEHESGLDEDGRFGSDTLGALESAFDIDAWVKKNQSKKKGTKKSTKKSSSKKGSAKSSSSAKFDPRTEKNLATLDPKAIPEMRKLVAVAMEVAKEEGVIVKVISGNRTWDEQNKLYAKGRTAPGKIVTKAKGGQSNHNFGIAVDLGVFQGGKYLDGSNPKKAAAVHRKIADRAKSKKLKTEWGGDWKSFPDQPHHEIKTGLKMSEKRKRYLKKGSVL